MGNHYVGNLLYSQLSKPSKFSNAHFHNGHQRLLKRAIEEGEEDSFLLHFLEKYELTLLSKEHNNDINKMCAESIEAINNRLNIITSPKKEYKE